jgi:hypothetical protein
MFARVLVCVCDRGTNVCPRAPGEGANDRPMRANVRFLNVFSTLERTSANDRPRMGERSLPQCANSHYARIKLKEKEKSKPKKKKKKKRTKLRKK